MATATDREPSRQVIQVIGPVIDVEFEGGDLPAVYTRSIAASCAGRRSTHPPGRAEPREGRVSTVAMSRPTAARGMEVRHRRRDSMPSAPNLGRVLNEVGARSTSRPTGTPGARRSSCGSDTRQQSTRLKISKRIKVIDLPSVRQGGKMGFLRRRGSARLIIMARSQHP